MEENSRRMRSYFYVENILKKHINIEKNHELSWQLMTIRDGLRAADYFDSRRKELADQRPKEPISKNGFSYRDYTREDMINYLQHEIAVENYYEMCDYKTDYDLIEFNKKLIQLLTENI